MIQIVVSELQYPTILEYKDLDGRTSVDCSYMGSTEELQSIRENYKKIGTIQVRESDQANRLACQLGVRLQKYSVKTIDEYKKALTDKADSTWRSLCGQRSGGENLNVLTSVVDQSLRTGKLPINSVLVVSECYHNNINVIDADVLLRLKKLEDK